MNLLLPCLLAHCRQDLGRFVYDLQLVAPTLHTSKLTIVGLVALDETPSVNVNDHASATALASQQIETADSLTESFHDVFGVPFFVRRELGDKSSFLSIGVSPDETIYNWRFSGFGVGEIRPDSVDLDILGYVVSISLFSCFRMQVTHHYRH